MLERAVEGLALSWSGRAFSQLLLSSGLWKHWLLPLVKQHSSVWLPLPPLGVQVIPCCLCFTLHVCSSWTSIFMDSVSREQTFWVSGLKVSAASYRRSCSPSVITWPSHLLWQKSPIKIKYLARITSLSAQVFKEKYEKWREEDSNDVVAFNLCLGCYWWEVRQVEEAALGSLLLIVWVKWKLSKYQAKTLLQKLSK